jgi:dihydropyrimidinase/dihydroorotase
MIADTVIKNCNLVGPEGIRPQGIAIGNGKIIDLVDDNKLPKAKKTIDAKGNFVLPGIIDNHTHFGGYFPLDEDIRIDSAAAAYGGITTVANTIGIGHCQHKGSFTEVVDKWIAIQEANAFTDFVMSPVLNSDIQLKEIHLVAGKWGICTFKIALAYKGFEAEQVGAISGDDGTMYLALKSIAELGLPARLMLHCENIDIINRLVPRIRDEDKRKDLAAWTDSRPGWTEALDIERAASIAKITKAPIYIVHLSSAEGVNAVAKARSEGVDVIAETLPAFLTLTKYSPLGALGKINPPLRDQESIERLWEGIQSGLVQCIGTDNAPIRMEMKRDIWGAAPGLPSIENYLPIMLSEGVNKKRITIEKLVQICCENNAKAMGIYPKKGTIRVGSDADLVIVDMNKIVKLTAKNLHQIADFCIWEGWDITGYPILTMLRGNIVMQDGKLLVKPGIGRYLPRFLG